MSLSRAAGLSMPGAAAMVLAAFATHVASAQQAQSPSVTLQSPLVVTPSRGEGQTPIGVLQRGRSEYDATGIRVGSFVVTPLLFSSLGYDDNVFATRTNPRSDGVFRIAPTALVRSDWARHAFVGEAAVENVKYFDATRLDGINARILGAGRIDLDRSSVINLNAGFSRSIDGSLTPTSVTPGLTTPGVNSLTPAITNRWAAGAGYAYTFNRLVITPSFNYQRLSYEALSGIPASNNQNQRNGETYTFANRVSYRISGPSSAFFEVAGNVRRYRTASLNSEGFRVSAGLATDFWRLVQGEIQAGMLHQVYAANQGTVTTPFLAANLRWYPTARATLGLFARREVGEPSSINIRPGITTYVGATGEFELRRNILATANYTYANVTSRNSSDSLHSISGGPVWLINRYAQLSAIYRHQIRDTTTPSVNYDRNQVLVQLRLGL